MNENFIEWFIISFITILVLGIGSAVYYDVVYQIPREKAYCESIGAERFNIYKTGTYCRTKDGSLIDIK